MAAQVNAVAAPMTIPSRRTWGQWRGYGTVRRIRGSDDETQSQTDTTYFRGMDGDQTAGAPRSVSVPDLDGNAVPDSNWLAGMTRQTVTYLGTTSTVVSRTTNDPYQYGPTSTEKLNDVTRTGYVVAVAGSTTHTTIAGKPDRVTRVTSTYAQDRTGRVVQSDDAGDVSTAADDRCTRTTYASSTDNRVLAFPVEAKTVSVACAKTPAQTDVLSDARVWYDDAFTSSIVPE